MKKIMVVCLGILWIGLPGCTHADAPEVPEPLDVQMIYESTSCGKIQDIPKDTPDARWVADKAHLKTIFNKMNRRRIGARPPEWVEDFNFTDYGILLVHMGQKPTGGYSLEYIPGRTYISGQTATVVLKWVRPDADALVTQIITNPCIMLKMPKADFSRINILDPHGKLKAAVNRNPPEQK